MRTFLKHTPMFVLVLAAMVTLAAYSALLTHVAFAQDARRLLTVRFASVPARPGEALAIWAHNSRLVLGVAICVVLVWVIRQLTPGRGGIERLPLWASDMILASWAITVVLAAGVLLGAYGIVQARAFWPYAPVEMSAWALLLSLYINTRNGHSGFSRIVCGLVWVEVLLAIAAILEASGAGL